MLYNKEIRRVRDIVCLLPMDQIRHMENVGILVGMMARRIYVKGIYKEEIHKDTWIQFETAGLYHDLGKVKVPMEILSKPGKLTEEEFTLIRRHPLYAAELFDYISEYEIEGIPCESLEISAEAAIYHHEWWDGNGYPFGLCKTEIPLIARVTSICDAYETITSNRTYRRAYSHEYACEELRKYRGTQFEPALVDLFLEYEADFCKISAVNLKRSVGEGEL